MQNKDDWEPSHPWPVVALGYLAALLLTVVVAVVVEHLTGWDSERVVIGTFGALVLLSAHPRAWWLWEVGDISAFAETCGIRVTRLTFFLVGLGMILLAVMVPD